MRTATEKYNAVLEGKFAKAEFVRQMRLEFPQLITQFNGFDDSVTILKNRGMIFEAKKEDKKIKPLEDNLPLEAIDRGVDVELTAMGIDPTGVVTKEQYMQAKKRAVSNLQKNQTHYIDLIAKESPSVDKNDKMKETKRGAKDVDTKNQMKNATLKEGVEEADAIPTEPGVPGERASNHERKMVLKQIIDFLTVKGHPKTGFTVSTDDALSYIKTHRDDIFNGTVDYNNIEDVWGDYDEFESVNRRDELAVDRMGRPKIDSEPSRFKGRDKSRLRTQSDEEDDVQETEAEYLAKKDAAIKKAMGKEDEVEEAVNAYTPGDMFSTDFDYEGMLKAGLKIRINTPVDTMQKIYDSFEDVNYHRENAHLYDVIEAVKEGDKGAALDALKRFRKEIKDTMSDIFEGAFPVRERDESYVPRNGVVKERVATLDNFISLIQDKAGDSGFPEEEEAMEVIEAIADHYGIKIQIGGLVGEKKVEVTELKDVEDGRDIGGKIIEFAGGKNVDVNVVYHRYKTKEFYDIPVEKAIDITNKYIDQNDLTQASTGEKDYILMIDDGDASIDIKKADDKKWDSDEVIALAEKKGKDHDGDGDIDKDDYMAAKDKAIKKATGKNLREAVKAIISKVLEEGTINEAATNELARIADDYAGFEGMKGAILDLQNLVTDIEAYYDKTRDKIQKVYDKLGEIRNEEGLKVGGFLAPAIETAFMKDLRPVTKQGFTKGLDQPKVRVLSQADVDAHNSGERPLGEDEFSPEPKKTVYTPNI